jgi:hypothetical protein
MQSLTLRMHSWRKVESMRGAGELYGRVTEKRSPDSYHK